MITRRFRTNLLFIWQAIIRLMLPAFCISCTKVLSLTENALCSGCLRILPSLKAPLCKTCSRPLAPFGQAAVRRAVGAAPYGINQARCRICRNTHSHVSRVRAAVPFDEQHRPIIHEFKFRKHRWILRAYERTIRRTLKQTSFQNCDIVVPIPISRKRRIEREFNQAEDLACVVARSLRLPVASRVLGRKTGARPQSALKRKERLANVKKQFYVKRKNEIEGRSILLVDDIYTTGATINECADQLRRAGARDVSAFVLARAV